MISLNYDFLRVYAKWGGVGWKESPRGREYMYTYSWLISLHSGNKHNIIKWLCLNLYIYIYIYVYDHLNRCRKYFWQNSTPFMRKSLQKVGTEGTNLNRIMIIYNKSTAIIIFNGGKLKAFPLESRIRQGCFLLSLLFSKILKILATATREEKENKVKF